MVKSYPVNHFQSTNQIYIYIYIYIPKITTLPMKPSPLVSNSLKASLTFRTRTGRAGWWDSVDGPLRNPINHKFGMVETCWNPKNGMFTIYQLVISQPSTVWWFKGGFTGISKDLMGSNGDLMVLFMLEFTCDHDLPIGWSIFLRSLMRWCSAVAPQSIDIWPI